MATSFTAIGPDGVLTYPSGTSSGVSIAGRGTGSLTIRGTTSLATVATGANTGTAGASTSTTQLFKPGAAANWTASNLVGKWLKITGGGGYSASRLTLRPIQSNTTTSLTVDIVSGMDTTTTFEIVDLAGLVDYISAGDTQAIRLSGCSGTVYLEGLAFSSAHALNGLIDAQDCNDIVITGCLLNQNTVQSATLLQRIGRVRVEHCMVQSSSDVEIGYCQNVTVNDIVNSSGGQVWFHDTSNVTVTKLFASTAPSTVLRIERVRNATAEVSASSGGATPIYLESVDNFSAAGSLLLTGTGNTGYGVEIAGSGAYVLTGSSITGTTNDVLFFGHATTWTILSGPDYGMVEEHAGNATARASYTKAVKYGNYLFDGSLDISGRMLLYGYLNQSANLSVPTFTASESYDMGAQGVRGFLECVCNSASAEVLLPNGAAIAGVWVGIVNRGSATLTVKPPVGGTINGAASTTIASGASKTFSSLNGSGGLDFWILT